MSESRFLKIVVIGLLLLNAGTLSYLLLDRGPGAKPGGPPMHRGAPGGPAHYLRERLRLTENQETQYRAMREAHHAEVVRIRDEIRGAQRGLYALLHDGYQPADSAAAAPFIDRVAARQRRIEWITYLHFRDLRGLCTPVQQKQFDAVIGEALEQLR